MRDLGGVICYEEIRFPRILDVRRMNISISLTPELIGLIKAKVESGRYTSTSEVVQEALRLLERSDARDMDASAGLRRAWNDGVASGDAGELDFADLKQEGRRVLAAKPRAERGGITLYVARTRRLA